MPTLHESARVASEDSFQTVLQEKTSCAVTMVASSCQIRRVWKQKSHCPDSVLVWIVFTSRNNLYAYSRSNTNKVVPIDYEFCERPYSIVTYQVTRWFLGIEKCTWPLHIMLLGNFLLRNVSLMLIHERHSHITFVDTCLPPIWNNHTIRLSQ